MSNYVAVAELKACKIGGEVVDLSMFTDAEIQAALDEAEEMIERLLGDWFYAKAVTQLIDGNGLYELYFFPEIPAKCLSLTSIKEVDVDGSTVLFTYTENDDFTKYDHYIRMFHLAQGYESPRVRSFQGGRWPRGERNIQIVGSFGWTTTPAAIVKATKYLALESLLPGSTNLASQDTSQASWPDFTVTFRGDSGRDGVYTTGYPEVDRWIQPYLNVVDMFMVVPDHRTLHSDSLFRD